MLPNNQTDETLVNNPSLLEVHSIFYTIQGEGPYAGHPAVFVRLAGCNLQCPGCDTDYTSNRETLTPNQIVDRILKAMSPNWDPEITSGPIVVITGGEPFRQNLTQLLELLVNRWAFTVQVETNGLLPFPETMPESVVIVCSPKTSNINRRNIRRINALKYVIHHAHVNPNDGLPLTALHHSNSGQVYRPLDGYMGKIYVQPMDEKDEEKNKLNRQAAVESCLKFGYVLQLQIHKIIGVE